VGDGVGHRLLGVVLSTSLRVAVLMVAPCTDVLDRPNLSDKPVPGIVVPTLNSEPCTLVSSRPVLVMELVVLLVAWVLL
jgi:hypothetical protein